MCVDRLTNRRYEPVSGRKINLSAVDDDPRAKDLSRWLADPRDDTSRVKAKLDACKQVKSELEAAYGFRTKEAPTGIMQVIDADGVGEPDLNGEQPPLQKVMESIEDTLVRPIPYLLKA